MTSQRVDRRSWLETDRPGERLALSQPLNGTRVISVTGSDRHWGELHEGQTLCLLDANQPGVGAVWHSGRSPSLRTAPGEVMAMEMGAFHRTTDVCGKGRFSVVQIEAYVLDRLAYQLERKRPPDGRAASLCKPALSRAIARFVTATAAFAPPLDLECLLLDVVCEFWGENEQEHRETARVPHRGIRLARDAIHDQFALTPHGTDSPRLEELARISGLSAARFSHAFKQWMGISPHAYLNLCRLTAGRRMLEQGISPTDAAVTLGFADLPHFSRRFRHQYGLGPRTWSIQARRTLPQDGEAPTIT